MAYELTPTRDDITKVTEAELRAELTTFIDRIAFADDELLVTRGGEPVAAVISIEGWRVLRSLAEGLVEQMLGEQRLRTLVGQ